MAEELSIIFPDIPQSILETIIDICGGSPDVATNYLLENGTAQVVQEIQQSIDPTAGAITVDDDDLEEHEDREGPELVGVDEAGDIGAQAPFINPQILQTFARLSEESQIEEESGEEEDVDDDEDDHGGEMFGEEWGRWNPPKKRRKVEDSVSHSTYSDSKEKRYYCAFDGKIVQKSHIELLNLHPSQLDHHFIHLWHSELPSTISPSTKNVSIQPSAACWAYFFPVQDIDHVWRVVLNAHIFGKKFGALVTIQAASFDIEKNDGQGVVRAYPDTITGPPSISELKRIGTGLLSVVGAIHNQSEVYYQPELRKKHAGWEKQQSSALCMDDDELNFDVFIMNCEYKLIEVRPTISASEILSWKNKVVRKEDSERYDLYRRDRTREGGNQWKIQQIDE